MGGNNENGSCSPKSVSLLLRGSVCVFRREKEMEQFKQQKERENFEKQFAVSILKDCNAVNEQVKCSTINRGSYMSGHFI